MRLLHSLLVIIMVISLTPISFFSQENEYTVITKSGEVFLINRVSKKQTEIQIGDKLMSKDKIQINLDGYLVLVDSNLQSVELSQMGLYNISGLDSMFTIKRNSITENITKFILDEMSTGSEKYNNMKTLGAVVRKASNIVETAVPKYGNIIDTLYNFAWYPLLKDSAYIFRIFNQNGNTLYMNEINDTNITLNLSKFNLQYHHKYYWSVFDKSSFDSELDSVSFKLISPKYKDQIFNELLNLKADFLIEDSPLNQYLIARYLSSKEFNESAIEYFKKSIQMLPESEFYWTEYIQFLLDVGMSREALIEWNQSPFSNNQIKDEG